MRRSALLLVLLVPALGGAQAPPPATATTAIDARRIRAHVAALADDRMEGRGPGTRGGKAAEAYVAEQLAAAGVAPGGEWGTYFQKVPLLGVTGTGASLTFSTEGKTLSPVPLEGMMVWTEAQKEQVDLTADVVFAGYGIEAPEYRWDDFKGVDVAGKLVILLVNDPPATAKEPDLFKGKALTYHGRWTYKLESATRHRARGALLVHTEDGAGYGWGVVRTSWSGELSQSRVEPGAHALELAGWLSEGAARKLMAQAGLDLDALRRAAGTRDFRPVPLRTTATASLRSTLRSFEAANVIGRIPGRDAALKDQAVIFSAHVDHLGIGTPDASGDRIYNGAVDDAAGVAALLEIARTVGAEGGWPRAVTFVGFTAEEQGLKGSAWYAAHPVVPPGATAACVNLDAAMPFGEVDDFVLMGADRSPELARIGAETARALGFQVRPDRHPEKGYFYRSDHFSLARVGIPCVNLQMGETLRGKPAGAGAARVEEYRKKRYHQPADQLDGTWDLAGLVQYATVGRELGRRIAVLPALPGWRPGDEFEGARRPR